MPLVRPAEGLNLGRGLVRSRPHVSRRRQHMTHPVEFFMMPHAPRNAMRRHTTATLTLLPIRRYLVFLEMCGGQDSSRDGVDR